MEGERNVKSMMHLLLEQVHKSTMYDKTGFVSKYIHQMNAVWSPDICLPVNHFETLDMKTISTLEWN